MTKNKPLPPKNTPILSVELSIMNDNKLNHSFPTSKESASVNVNLSDFKDICKETNPCFPKQVIILSGGVSICEGIEKELWDKIRNKFILSTNFCHPVFLPSLKLANINPTALIFRDSDCFYTRYLEQLKEVPLIIGHWYSNLINIKLPNTILIKNIKNGITGVWALNFATKIMNEGDTIFILGQDVGGIPTTESLNFKIGNVPLALRDITEEKLSQYSKDGSFITINNRKYAVRSHWYDGEFSHKGTAKIGFYYEDNNPKKWYLPFKKTKQKIYNVSSISQIPEDLIPKINYEQFFSMLLTENHNQTEIREKLRKRTNEIRT